MRFRKLKHILLFSFVILSLLAALAFTYFRRAIRPTLISMAENEAKNRSAEIINECILQELESGEYDYNSLVTTQKDSEGKISALQINGALANRLKSNMSVNLAKELSELEDNSFRIPMGNALNLSLLSGKGPDFNVKILSVGSLFVDFDNDFTTKALNQTLHRVMLNVRLCITMYIPFSVKEIEYSTAVCIAETVIVGDIPEAYTYVSEKDGDETAGLINDYGAQNYMN